MRSTDTAARDAAEIAAQLEALDRIVVQGDAAGLPAMIAALERLKTVALARLIALTAHARVDTAPANPMDDLRHLTPLQVAELLNLKEAYIHELCRSTQMPAVKRGKYWMIPVAPLPEWLTRARRGIDPHRAESLRFPDQGTTSPSSTGARRSGRA